MVIFWYSWWVTLRERGNVAIVIIDIAIVVIIIVVIVVVVVIHTHTMCWHGNWKLVVSLLRNINNKKCRTVVFVGYTVS